LRIAIEFQRGKGTKLSERKWVMTSAFVVGITYFN